MEETRVNQQQTQTVRALEKYGSQLAGHQMDAHTYTLTHRPLPLLEEEEGATSPR